MSCGVALRGAARAAASATFAALAALLLTPAALTAGGDLDAESDSAFAACDAALSANPEAETGPKCVYDTALGSGAIGPAAERLEAHLARHDELPWPAFYLGNLRMITDCGAAEAAYRQAASGFAAFGDPDGESRARANLVLLLPYCDQPERGRAEVPAALEAARASRDPLAELRVRLAESYLPIRAGGDLAALYRRLVELWEEVDPATADQRQEMWGLRRGCLRALSKVSLELGDVRASRDWSKERRDEALALEKPRDVAAAVYDRIEARTFSRPTTALRQRILDEAKAALPSTAAHFEAQAGTHLLIAKLSGAEQAASATALDHLDRCQELAEQDATPAGPTMSRRCAMAAAALRLSETPAAAGRALDDIVAQGLLGSEGPKAWIEIWDDHLPVLWATQPRHEALAAAERVLRDIEAWRAPQTGAARVEILEPWTDAYAWLVGHLLLDASGEHLADPADVGIEPLERGEALRLAFATLERLRAQALREALLLEGLESPQLAPPPLDLLDTVLDTLGEREALITFLLASDEDFSGRFAGGAWALTLTRQGARAHRLDYDGTWAEGAVKTLIAHEDGPWNPIALGSLYEILLAPALDALPADIERLVLVPDGILHLLPFAALRSGTETPALIERFEIEIEPSASLWQRWREAPALQPSEDGEVAALVLADPAPADSGSPQSWRGGYGPLPAARREGRSVRRHLRASQVLVGEEASEEFLKSVDLEPYGILHFATHATADQERPWDSGVLLAAGGAAEDGWLHPAEIAELDVRDKVVILSTCDSAVGSWRRGEGALSLARSFFEAGAQAVVATLSPLDDDAGAAIFDEIYRELRHGSSLGGAVAAAQRLHASRGAPPSEWASLVVLGNGELVPIPGGIPPRWEDHLRVARPWLLLGILAMLGGLVSRLRRT